MSLSCCACAPVAGTQLVLAGGAGLDAVRVLDLRMARTGLQAEADASRSRGSVVAQLQLANARRVRALSPAAHMGFRPLASPELLGIAHLVRDAVPDAPGVFDLSTDARGSVCAAALSGVEVVFPLAQALSEAGVVGSSTLVGGDGGRRHAPASSIAGRASLDFAKVWVCENAVEASQAARQGFVCGAMLDGWDEAPVLRSHESAEAVEGSLTVSPCGSFVARSSSRIATTVHCTATGEQVAMACSEAPSLLASAASPESALERSAAFVSLGASTYLAASSELVCRLFGPLPARPKRLGTRPGRGGAAPRAAVARAGRSVLELLRPRSRQLASAPPGTVHRWAGAEEGGAASDQEAEVLLAAGADDASSVDSDDSTQLPAWLMQPVGSRFRDGQCSAHMGRCIQQLFVCLTCTSRAQGRATLARLAECHGWMNQLAARQLLSAAAGVLPNRVGLNASGTAWASGEPCSQPPPGVLPVHLCAPCAKRCHLDRGHQIVALGLRSSGHCECGSSRSAAMTDTSTSHRSEMRSLMASGCCACLPPSTDAPPALDVSRTPPPVTGNSGNWSEAALAMLAPRGSFARRLLGADEGERTNALAHGHCQLPAETGQAAFGPALSPQHDHNDLGRWCFCNSLEQDLTLQCIVCRDWFHKDCLNGVGEGIEDTKARFPQEYESLPLPGPDGPVLDIVHEDMHTTLICAGCVRGRLPGLVQELPDSRKRPAPQGEVDAASAGGATSAAAGPARKRAVLQCVAPPRAAQPSPMAGVQIDTNAAVPSEAERAPMLSRLVPKRDLARHTVRFDRAIGLVQPADDLSSPILRALEAATSDLAPRMHAANMPAAQVPSVWGGGRPWALPPVASSHGVVRPSDVWAWAGALTLPRPRASLGVLMDAPGRPVRVPMLPLGCQAAMEAETAALAVCPSGDVAACLETLGQGPDRAGIAERLSSNDIVTDALAQLAELAESPFHSCLPARREAAEKLARGISLIFREAL